MTIIEKTIKSINLQSRYITLCEKYSDIHRSLRQTQKKEIIEYLGKEGLNFEYVAKDKFYKITADFGEYTFQLGLKLNNGIIEPFVFIFKNGLWILYNRIDFLIFENNPSFNRAKYNILYYDSYHQMIEIVISLLSIYDDFRVNFLILVEEN
jgi:hypothetical protein